MSFIMVDIEADGPIPGDYSMVSLGAVIVDQALDKTFYGQLKPISENWNPKALEVSGHTREETLAFDAPKQVMENFKFWIEEHSTNRPVFISDNNGFDWMFVCWYFHHFIGENPFGFSSRRLTDLYCGLKGDARSKWKHLRKTKHTHNPVDDAMGNAEVLWIMKNELKLKIDLK